MERNKDNESAPAPMTKGQGTKRPCVSLTGGLPPSTECAIHRPFSVRHSGNIGQEILDQDGKIIAWTTDPWIAQVICKLLTDNEGMIPR
jgi:hypothetical protein